MEIEELKEKYTCLDLLGDRIVRRTGRGYLARCPWRADNHPSLSVTLNGKGWLDHATGEKGSVIDMAMKCLGTTDVRRACEDVEKRLFFFNQPSLKSEVEKSDGFKWLEVVPLQSKALFAYLYSRKINVNIAKQFLKEAHYSFRQGHDSYLYALAYGNDKGGYELRSSRFKGATAPKGITTHMSKENAPTVVFEGFFDMLSFATLCGGVKHNYICLNSIVNVPPAIEVLKDYNRTIYLCLDNDGGGERATLQMQEALPRAVDIRRRFAPYKDVNDYLLKKIQHPP